MIFSEIDKQLLKLWQEILGHVNVLPTTSFMSVGGDNITFSVLVKRLSKKFKIDCSPIKGEKLLTYYQQANFLKISLKKTDKKIIIPICSGNHSTKLILVHPIGGGLFGYAHVIKLLKTKMSIIGLQDASMCGLLYYYNSLEEQAREYIHYLNMLPDLNSIILLGHSYGGSLAFEIARQLKKTNIEVKYLIIIDAWAEPPFNVDFKNNFKNIILRQVEKLKLNEFISSEEVKKRWLDLLWHRAVLLLRYKPTKIDVHGTVIAAKESLPEYDVKKEGIQLWSNYLLSAAIYRVSGNHENIMHEDNAHNVAYIVNQILKCF